MRLPPHTAIRKIRKPGTCKSCKQHIPVGTTVLSYHVLPTDEKPDHSYQHECQFCAAHKVR